MFNKYNKISSLLLGFLITTSAIAPLTISLVNTPNVLAQNSQFSDVNSNHWANEFINSLVQRKVIAGFPDGTFKPDAPVTRAQFAAMLRQALSNEKVRNSITFRDVPENYWANNAISNAYETGFLSGYPQGLFRPEQNISREQVLVSLANGLKYGPDKPVGDILSFYDDANAISSFAQAPIAAATEQNMVINYPWVIQLNPTLNATRGEVAALIYQALASKGKVPMIDSPYIVK